MKEMKNINNDPEQDQSINNSNYDTPNNNDKDNDNEDDIVIENTTSDISSLKANHTKQIKPKSNSHSNSTDIDPNRTDITEEQMKRMISDYDPPKIKDWPTIPYKTIFITLLLFFSSILFLYNGITKFKNNESWDQYLSYLLLGGMLIIPGGYYSFMLVNILIGTEGYEYKILPKLNN